MNYYRFQTRENSIWTNTSKDHIVAVDTCDTQMFLESFNCGDDERFIRISEEEVDEEGMYLYFQFNWEGQQPGEENRQVLIFQAREDVIDKLNKMSERTER